MRNYSNRVLDGQIFSQKKKLKALNEKEAMLEKQNKKISEEDLAARNQYESYLAELKKEKELR